MSLLIMLDSVSGTSTFRDDDHRTLVSLRISLSHCLGDFFPFEWNLRDEDHICAPADPSVQGDPSCVPAHYFQDHCPFVTGGSRVQSIEGVGHAAHRGVKAKRHGGGFDVVIDRLRNTDNWETQIKELQCGCQRTVAANDDQTFDAEFFQSSPGLIDNVVRNHGFLATTQLGNEMTFIRGSEYCPTLLHDSSGRCPIQYHELAGREETFESITETDDLPIQLLCCFGDTAQNRVQSWTIAAAGQYSDPFSKHSPYRFASVSGRPAAAHCSYNPHARLSN
jgi:hypothetical protein